MKRVILPALLTILAACQRDANSSIQPMFDATVQAIGGDCRLPLLDFGTRTNEVAQLAGTPLAGQLYYAINLPTTYWKPGQTLTTTIRPATTSDQSACTAMGPAYPTVVIMSAEGK